MALLEKLSVSGIRCFGSDSKAQVITFEVPLTLILGRNGCGKTTIIESLKYACTGGFPGQGANFVRDPKLDGLVETRAQVKLQFKSCQQKGIVVTKSMQTLQKLKKLEFKTLDSTVSVQEANGEKSHMSGRCSDVDEVMLQFLGVSKPILNYVIFCHQEDSHWPLEEGKKVKEKFDEIFDSTKYNKCMLAVRELRNKIVKEKLSKVKVQINFLESIVQQVKQKRGELKVFQERYKETEEKIEGYRNNIRECRKEYDTWKEKDKNFRQIEKERDDASSHLKYLSSMVEDLKNLITHKFTGTEDELKVAIISFTAQLEEKKEAYEQNKNEVNKMNSAEASFQKNISNVQTNIGKLEEAKKHENSLKESRNCKLSNLALEFGLSQLQEDASETDVKELSTKLEKELNRLDVLITSMKHKHEDKEKELLYNVQKCAELKSKLRAEIAMKEDSVASTDSDIKSLKEKLNQVNQTVAKKQRIEADLQKCREELQKANQAEDSAALVSEIEDLRKDCRDLEARQQKILEEVRCLTVFAEKQRELTTSQERVSEFQTNIRRLRSSNKEFILRHLKNSDDNSIKYDFDLLKLKLRKDVEQNKKQLNEKRQDIRSLEDKIRHKKDQLKEKEGELAKNEELLFQMCRTRDLDDVLSSVNTEIDSAQSNKGLVSSSEFVYNRYIKELEEPNPCCPLCLRDFNNENESSTLIESLKKKVSDLPSAVAKMNENLSKLQEQQRKLLQLKPVQQRTWDLQSHEIPKLREELDDLLRSLGDANEEEDLLKANLQNPETDLENAEKVQSDVFDIDRYHKETKQATRRITQLKQDLPSTHSSRTCDEAFAEQQLIQEELTSKRSLKDIAEERQSSYEKQINDLQKKVNLLVAEQLNIQELVKKEDSMKERLTELYTQKSVLEAEKSYVEDSLGPALEQEKKAEEVFSNAKSHNRQELEEKQKEKDGKAKQMISIKELQTSLSQMEKRNLTETLQKEKLLLDSLLQKQCDFKKKREKLQSEIMTLSADIEGHKQKEKELSSNLSLMEKEKEIEKARENLQSLVEMLGSLDCAGVRAKCDELLNKHSQITKKENECVGNLQGLEENIQSRKDELNNSHFKDAERKYKEKFVECTVLSHVEKDLQKYYNALDYAMQRFHEDRMKSVNKIVRELWRLIYKGNDIDYIEIKTDESTAGTNATAGTEKRKIYNYRVVQVKSGTEIEMRGRCSAGQKVLASLIIRMALAETFSANCGILTLDEPTTNLDKKNISSLSTAITRIVHEHQNRKNFQLIVITHDHEFLESMSEADFFSHYYEVSRDKSAKSVITRKDLNKM